MNCRRLTRLQFQILVLVRRSIKILNKFVETSHLGAMENWGLITYREQYLIGEKDSHPRDVLEILKTTAHELGHQFFGEFLHPLNFFI